VQLAGDAPAFFLLRRRHPHAHPAQAPERALELFLATLALDGVCEHVGHGLHEVHVVRRKATPLARCALKHAIRSIRRVDHDRKPLTACSRRAC
jgi:hypothetical protein